MSLGPKVVWVSHKLRKGSLPQFQEPTICSTRFKDSGCPLVFWVPLPQTCCDLTNIQRKARDVAELMCDKYNYLPHPDFDNVIEGANEYGQVL